MSAYRATCRLCAAALNRDTGYALEPGDCPACGPFAAAGEVDETKSLRAELATVTAERDRLEHDTDALSKHCLAQSIVFERNPNVCQVYSELQAKAWAIVSLSGRERIEADRHQYVVKLDALREELAETKAALEQTQAYLATANGMLSGTNYQTALDALEASRSETAAATARIAELEALFQQTHGVHVSWVAKVTETETALRELRERVRDGVNHRNWNEVLEAISERQ